MLSCRRQDHVTQEPLRQAPEKWEKIEINQGVDPRDATLALYQSITKTRRVVLCGILILCCSNVSAALAAVISLVYYLGFQDPFFCQTEICQALCGSYQNVLLFSYTRCSPVSCARTPRTVRQLGCDLGLCYAAWLYSNLAQNIW